MDEFLDVAASGLGLGLGTQKLRAKRRNVVIGNMFDDSKPPNMFRDDEDDEEDAVDLTDPSHPDYRAAQPTEKPSPRAQWDDARSCWIEWSKAVNDWVVVGPVPASDEPEGTLDEP